MLEYSSPVWDPYKVTDIQKLEAVQRNASRFVKGDFKNTSIVSMMLNDLGWNTLESRRREKSQVSQDCAWCSVGPSCRLQAGTARSRATNTFYTFFPRTIRHWNLQSHAVRQLSSIEQFKTAVAQLDYHDVYARTITRIDYDTLLPFQFSLFIVLCYFMGRGLTGALKNMFHQLDFGKL